MHSIKLNVPSSVYNQLMNFLAKDLTSIKIVEDIELTPKQTSIDMADFKIKSFRKIEDPLAWQQKLRSEWE